MSETTAELVARLSLNSDWEQLGAGRVDPTDARLWYRTGHTCQALHFELLRDGQTVAKVTTAHHGDARADGTATVQVSELFGVALEPDTTYRVQLHRGLNAEQLVGQAEFRTAPLASSQMPICIAWWSCNQPLDDNARVRSGTGAFIEALIAEFSRRGVRAVFPLGDQMYTDQPEVMSLFNAEFFEAIAPPNRASVLECTREEVRALWHQRYREWWKPRELRALTSLFATCPMHDDHEFIDNFGSHPAHSGLAWTNLRLGALDAFWDYQATRVHGADGRSGTADFALRLGALSICVPDLRSDRVHDGEELHLISSEQLRWIASVAAANEDATSFVLGLTIPLLPLSDSASDAADALTEPGSDFDDRWSHPAARHCRTALLELLRDIALRAPHRKLVLLGGDIHAASLCEVDLGGGACALSLTASPLSHPQSEIARALRFPFELEVELPFGEHTARITLPQDCGDTNPFGGVNAGILSVDPVQGTVRSEILTFDGESVSTVLDTGWR